MSHTLVGGGLFSQGRAEYALRPYDTRTCFLSMRFHVGEPYFMGTL